MDLSKLSDRQLRELEYHARSVDELVKDVSVPFDCLDPAQSRSWNAYWRLYEFARTLDLKGKRVLVMGCGFGDDAIAFSKLGAEVYAFDLSGEELSVARRRADHYALPVQFDQMVAENLEYPDGFFDLVVAIDIIHHCDIPRAVAEMHRVAKRGAVVIFNELYTHKWLQRIRKSRLIEKYVYPSVARALYGDCPYITTDERKLDERDLDFLCGSFRVDRLEFFEVFVNRFIRRSPWLARIETRLLASSRFLGRLAGGRFVLIGRNP
jgi:ubiquinone/menaquinone biosynthesis C-methylase UbiE